VTKDPARRHLGDIPLQDVQIGTANRGGVDADDGVGLINHHRVGNLVPTLVVRTVIYESFHGDSSVGKIVEYCVEKLSG
jgi:hypothetical protein